MEQENLELVKLLRARDADYMEQRRELEQAPELYGSWTRAAPPDRAAAILVSDSDDDEADTELTWNDPTQRRNQPTCVDKYGFSTSWHSYDANNQMGVSLPIAKNNNAKLPCPPPKQRPHTSRPGTKASRPKSCRKNRPQSSRIGCGGISHDFRSPLTVHVLKRNS